VNIGRTFRDTALPFLGIGLLVLLAFYTGRALVKRAQVRGFVSGAKTELKLVTDKAVLTSSDGEDKVYYLAWDSADIKTRGASRIALPKTVWSKYAVGDQVEIVYLDNDTRPYHREGSYASNQNLIIPLFFLFYLVAMFVGPIYGIGRKIFPHRRPEKVDAVPTAIRQEPKHQPDDSDSWFSLGLSLSNEEQGKGAEAAFRKAIELNPDFPEAWYFLGTVYEQMDRYDDAVAAYRQAIDLKPDYVQARFTLGHCHRRHGDYDDAVATLQQATKIKPDESYGWWSLGMAYMDQGQNEQAILSYCESIKLKPEFSGAWGFLGSCYQKQGKYDDAVTAYHQAIKLQPDDSYALCGLGNTYEAQSKCGEALEAYLEAIKQKPDDPHAWFKLGSLYQKQGKRSEALGALDHLRKLDPSLADKLAGFLSSK
jgi:tetratricopeptide (TPR) repeat protein